MSDQRLTGGIDFGMNRVDFRIPKGCVPLGTYRVEKTRGLIDGMGTVGLPGTNGHNGSIEYH